MKTTTQSIFVAAVMVALSAAAIAAPGAVPANSGASSVSEMMQRKQEHQIRDRLVAAGLWNQVRQMDEDLTVQKREAQQTRITRANEAISHGNGSRASDEDKLLEECVPEKKLRL